MATVPLHTPPPHTAGPSGAPPQADLLRHRLDAAAAARPQTPLVALAAVCVAVAVALVAGPAAAAVALVVGTLAVLVARRHDRTRRTVAVTCGTPPSRHEQLVAIFERLRCEATSWEPQVWEVGEKAVHHPVSRRCDGPRHLRADGPVPTFAGTRREVALLPEHVVLRDGRFHTVVGYDALEVAASVQERAGGGRLGRLTVRAAGLESVYDLASIDAACELAAALRGMTDAQHRPAGRWPVEVPAQRRESQRRAATGSPWASPTVAL